MGRVASCRMERPSPSGSVRREELIVPTSAGNAHVALDGCGDPAFLLVLTHSAGGGVDAPDLLTVRDAALGLGGAVARVLQPYRVAGGRAPGSAVRQDQAWCDIVADLRERLGDVPLIAGGRSNGARVACRTAVATGARGVLALAFPLHPPGKPEKSRVEELRSAPEVVVVNGSRDPFGIPDAADVAHLHVVAGQAHALRGGPELAAVVEPWLTRWRDR